MWRDIGKKHGVSILLVFFWVGNDFMNRFSTVSNNLTHKYKILFKDETRRDVCLANESHEKHVKA